MSTVTPQDQIAAFIRHTPYTLLSNSRHSRGSRYLDLWTERNDPTQISKEERKGYYANQHQIVEVKKSKGDSVTIKT